MGGRGDTDVATDVVEVKDGGRDGADVATEAGVHQWRWARR